MGDSLDLILRADDPLLRGHVVEGRRMLPGLAYPDLMFRLARRKGLSHGDYSLDRLTIIQPLAMGATEQVHLRVSFTRIEQSWQVIVAGSTRNERGHASEDVVFAKAELQEQPIELNGRIDVVGMKSSARERIDMNDIYALAGSNGLRHAGLIRAIGTMHVLPSGGLVELAVDPQYVSGQNDVLCHPTLLDGAAMACGGLGFRERSHEREGLFVPLACDSFRLSRPLRSRCVALIELSSFKSVHDIRKLDMDFFDEHGMQAAALRGLTAKLVGAELRSAAVAGEAASIQAMLREILARYLKRDAASIDLDAGFYEMGFKSADLLLVLADIENRLDMKLAPSLLFEYTTLSELSRFLSEARERAPGVQTANTTRPMASAANPQPSQQTRRPPVEELATPAQACEPNPLALLPQWIDRLAAEPERTSPIELRGIELCDEVPTEFASACTSVREAIACPTPGDRIDLQLLLRQSAAANVDVRTDKLDSLPADCGAWMPAAIETLRIFRSVTAPAYLISRQRSASPLHKSFDAFLVTEAGEIIAEAVDVTVIRSRPARSERVDIAVIGMSGRYPGARDVDEFWRNLRQGVDCISEVPESRWNWKKHYGEEAAPPARHNSKWGGFIAGVDEFDAEFFGIPADEAALLDPQERLFLQEAWSAMEDAGYTRESLAKVAKRSADPAAPNEVSVYVGAMYADYQLNAVSANAVPISPHLGAIANRVSYLLNLHGPSMAVDALCASSLAAIHLACEDLRTARSRMAIAGGVNLTLHPNKYAHLSAAGLLSSSSTCESLGRGSDGYVSSEGVGALLLKRLSDAEADGDQILGVIRGSVVNHGGKSGGFSIPNLKLQRAVIERALAAAEVHPREVSYVEAHATGTVLGDPIEVTALTQAFRKSTSDLGYCRLGSVKNAIGHAESAAGIAGVTKILLQLRHERIAPTLHVETINPHIDLAGSPFIVDGQLCDWPRPIVEGANGEHREVPRTAGISSFGATGTHAHLIIQEYRPTARSVDSLPLNRVGQPLIVPLSARNDERLREAARRLRMHIEQWLTQARVDDKTFAARSYARLMNIAWTMQVGREVMSARRALVTHSLDDLREQLQALEQREERAMSTAVRELSAHRELRAIAERWVRGERIDWTTLQEIDSDYRPRRISLPTYPFARQRHWVEPRQSTSVAQFGDSAQRAVPDNAQDRIEMTLRHAVARQLHRDPEQIATQVSFFELGLDSLGIVQVSQQIGQLFQAPISPTVLFEHDDIAALAAHLAERMPAPAPALDRDVLTILEDLKSGALTAHQACELVGEE